MISILFFKIVRKQQLLIIHEILTVIMYFSFNHQTFDTVTVGTSSSLYLFLINFFFEKFHEFFNYLIFLLFGMVFASG